MSKKWKAGREMPMYSGKSWGELEDIFPRQMKLSSEVYKVISVIAPAWVATKSFIKSTYGHSIRWETFTYMCWMQRVEDAKEDVCFEGFSVYHGLSQNRRLFWLKKSEITKHGLIENLPIPRARLYRLTGKGKMIMRKFHDEVELAHKNLSMWQSWKNPDHALNNITPKLRDFFEIDPPAE